tara:strand:- start:1482 stop:2564 length:1083 start_codon:yes stop_codon:yes gene_type:complete
VIIKKFKVFNNKRIIVTGHTGFKGSWLTLWLTRLNANVLGISKELPSTPSHFNTIKLKNKIIDKRIDIKNYPKLNKIINDYKPDFIFHLAAQSLVSKSYQDPLDTFETNVIGTANLLQSIRNLKNKCTVILVTSDKSYKNLEIKRGYHENDLLGGKDPYSGSKASAEMLINSYLSSFFEKGNKSIAVCRAGNVIGGGDWSEDRVIPDCIKAWLNYKKPLIRNPKSTRPWQHVLEVVSGYMLLAVKLSENKKLHKQIFNFGPSNKRNHTVLQLINQLKINWPTINWDIKKKQHQYFESKLLKLNSNKIKKIIGWKSVLSFNETSKLVSDWYKNFTPNKNMYNLSCKQIEIFSGFFEKRIKK